jgi:hypothetical protein
MPCRVSPTGQPITAASPPDARADTIIQQRLAAPG